MSTARIRALSTGEADFKNVHAILDLLTTAEISKTVPIAEQEAYNAHR